ncbi:sterol desaturase family protein [Azohydromonas caseinilytica]|uniref:Beta-carotene hydroxylase n=1 Tax=Azohydromonas caseinilytica TaxID=2728836 RepID=A0A848FAZ0_9BURK|nr:sterol desaturase family protein [Azohydromonas caseinilytica]NML16458.1 beta-carotene hydroxylase [Azohydromonas caseinilytica]
MLLPKFVHLLAFLAGFAAMEVVAWAMHRWVMHGPLWCWHRSHHEPGGGSRFERNDLFGLVFAALAIALFWIGTDVQWRALWWMALGITAYGLLYVLVHDGLVHRRIPFPFKARRGYLLRLVRAHLLHHRSRERDGAVAFGFLWAPDPERLEAQWHAQRRR